MHLNAPLQLLPKAHSQALVCMQIKVVVMGAILQAEGIKAIASLGYERYGAYVPSLVTIQVRDLFTRGSMHSVLFIPCIVLRIVCLFCKKPHMRCSPVTLSRLCMCSTISDTIATSCACNQR